MLTGARILRDKCPLVGEQEFGEQILVYVLFLLPSLLPLALKLPSE